MRHNRTLFLSGFDPKSPLIVHVTSRIVGRQFLLKDPERETFVQIMRELEAFTGLRILSHCVMSNHFHILIEIPAKNTNTPITDEEFNSRLTAIYSEQHIKSLHRTIAKLKKNKAAKALRELKETYTRRMESLPEFMKALKQRFSRWYNRTQGRRGTLWEERYSATAVSAGHTARLIAAYIDLNPLRANIVQNPAKYRWSSYAEALAGNKKAQAAYQYLHQTTDQSGAATPDLTPHQALENHRILLAEEGQAADQTQNTLNPGQRNSKRKKRRHGYTEKQAQNIIKKQGQLTQSQLLRCKTRYFTDGIVIGTKTFVDTFHKNTKHTLKSNRKSHATPLKTTDTKIESPLHTYRNLTKTPFGTT